MIPADPFIGRILLFPIELYSLVQPHRALHPPSMLLLCGVSPRNGSISLRAWAADWGLSAPAMSALGELGRARADFFSSPLSFGCLKITLINFVESLVCSHDGTALCADLLHAIFRYGF